MQIEQQLMESEAEFDYTITQVKNQLEQEKKSSELYKLKCTELSLEFQIQNESPKKYIELENKVVMMASEIERLKRQLDEKCKDVEQMRAQESYYQKQIEDSRLKFETQSKVMFQSQFNEVNNQHQQEIQMLEEQIGSQKCRMNDLKSQLEQYITELNKSNQRYTDCYKERDEYFEELQRLKRENELFRMQVEENERDIDGLNERIKIMENKHTISMNEAKSNYEYTKRSILDKEVRELMTKFNIDKQNFENQIRNLNQKLIDSENKFILATQENERMHFRYNEKNQELEQVKSKLLTFQMERQKINAECEDWKVNYQSLESSYQNKLQELQEHFETQIQRRLSQEVESVVSDWNHKSSNQQREYNLLEQNYLNALERLLLQSIEIERLIITRESRERDYEYFKQQFIEMQNEYNQQIEEIKFQYSQELNIKIIQISSETQKEQQQLLIPLQEKLQEYQEQIALLSQENERQNGAFKQKEQSYHKQITKLNYENQDLQKESQQGLGKVIILSVEMERLLQWIDELAEQLNTMNIMNNEMNIQLNEQSQQSQLLEKAYEQLKSENSQICDHYEQLQNHLNSELSNRKKMNSELQKELERMDLFYKKQLEFEMNQNEKDRMRILVQAVEIERLEICLDEWSSQLSNFDLMMKSLNLKLEEKDRQLQESLGNNDSIQQKNHQKIQQLLNSMQEKDSILNQLNQSLQNKEGQIQELQKSAREKDQLILQLSEQLSESKDLIEELNEKIRDKEYSIDQLSRCKDAQISELNSKIGELEQKLAMVSSQCLMLKVSKEEQEKSIKKLVEGIANLESENGELVKRLSEEMEIKISYQNQLALLQNEVERLEMMSTHKNNEFQSLELEKMEIAQQLDAKEEQLNSLQDQAQKQEEESSMELNQLKQTLFNIMQENEQLRKKSETQKSEMEELYLQIESFQQEIQIFEQSSFDVRDLEIKYEAEKVKKKKNFIIQMAWETSRDSLLKQIKEAQRQIHQQTGEIQRFTQVIGDKQSEIDRLKSKLLDSQIQKELDALEERFQNAQDTIEVLEQERVKMNSTILSLEKQIKHLQSEMNGKQSEIDQVYSLLEKKRKEGEMSNKDIELSKRNLKDLQNKIQDLEGEIRQSEQMIRRLQTENDEMKQSFDLLTRELKQENLSQQQKIKDLSEKIIELNKILQKYQSQKVLSSQQSVMTTSKVSYFLSEIKQITTTSVSRLNLKPSIQNSENENSFTPDSVSRMKSSSSVPPQQERQAMSVLNKDFH